MARHTSVVSLILFSLFVLFEFSERTAAQSAPPTQITPSNETGTNPYGTYSTGGGDVSLSNGNLSLQLPLVTLPGRNGHNFVLSAQYDSKIWSPTAFYANTGQDLHYNWQAEKKDFSLGSLGWQLNWPTIRQGPVLYDQVGTFVGYGDYIVTLPDGSKHHLGARSSPQDSEDGAYLRIASNPSNPTTSVVTEKNGTTIHFPAPTSAADTIEDTDGNYISMNASGVVDTVGRQITFSNAGGNGSTRITQISYKDSNGTLQTTTLNYTQLTILSTTAGQYYTGTTPFALPVSNVCQGICHRHIYVSQPPVNYVVTLLTSIVLPNGKSYTFTYNGYGEITKIQFPTGGYVAYDYAAFTHLETYWSSYGLNIGGDFREVTKRHFCRDSSGTCGGSGTPEDITTFTPTVTNTTAGNTKMDVVDPLGYKNHHEFSGVAQTSYAQYSSSREVLHQIYSETGVLLRATATTYVGLPVECGSSCPVFPLTVTTTEYDTPANPLVSKVQYVYDTYTANVTRPFYDPTNGTDYTNQSATTITSQVDNPTQVIEYGYGIGAPASSPFRTKAATWLKVFNGVDYPGTLHILDRKTNAQVLDASSAKISETQYEYDSFTEGLTASGAVQHDSAFGTGNTHRGKLTAIKQWRNTDGTYLTTRFQYDDAGNARKAVDPLNDATIMSYADSWGNATCTPSGGNAAAYLTSVTNALGHTTSAKYNSCAGTMASITDVNNKVTSYSYDLLDRHTQANLPDGGQTTRTFNESSFPLSVTDSTVISASVANLVRTTVVDGLGRVSQTQLNSDPAGVDYAETTYDGLGRKKTVTNPHRSSSLSTDGTTSYVYDALGRACAVVPPGGTAVAGSSCPTTAPAGDVFTSFSTGTTGACTIVTDEAGKARKSCSDAPGRLTAVWEDPATLNYETDYAYNVLDNLTSVTQKGGAASTSWRNRSFIYNSLSQLTQAQNPESGTISYAYDANSNLQTKTSPAPNQTGSATQVITYCYDVLSRLTMKGYGTQACTNGTLPTPVASYFYDQTSYNGLTIGNGKGRRTGMSDASGATAWSLDLTPSVGWKTTEARTINGFTKNLVSQNNLDGSLASVTYASGSVLAYTYNSAGQVTTVQDTAHTITYMQGTAYYPPGQLNLATYGSVNQTNIFNARLQPCWIYAATGTQLAGTKLCTDTGTTANLLDLKYSFGYGVNDNGNVLGITNNRDSDRSVSYTYDALNRIASAATANTDCSPVSTNPSLSKNWGETFTVDAWGNLAARTITKCSADPLSVTVLTNNQLSSFGYDSAGNMTSNGGASYTYDAENQLSTTGGVTYTYDGDGNRVKKSNGTLYWGTGPLLESDGSGALQREFIFVGGKRIARRDISGGAVHYYFTDNLGSTDVVTTAAGTLENDSAYYPYGGERTYLTNLANQNYKFTGKERDTESGLDEFGARYYTNALGRFMIPDWAAKPTAVPYANFGNPQSLNLYSYVQNNPTTFGDPDGHLTGAEEIVAGAAAGAIIVGAAATIYAHQHSGQHDAGQALHQAYNNFKDNLKGMFSHPDNSGKVGPVPGTVPANVPFGLPGTTSITLDKGVPPLTSQQGTVNTSAIQSSSTSPVAQPNPNGQISVGPSGTAVVIPPGQAARPADNGKGVVIGPPATVNTSNANTIRLMDPTPASPTGYVRVYNGSGQPINPSTGKPDTQDKTHSPL